MWYGNLRIMSRAAIKTVGVEEHFSPITLQRCASFTWIPGRKMMLMALVEWRRARPPADGRDGSSRYGIGGRAHLGWSSGECARPSTLFRYVAKRLPRQDG